MEIEGTTLKIYKFMVLYGKPIGVRELHRKLKLSSPSLASYHLNKLEKMGLVRKTENNKYVVSKVVNVDILPFFIKMGRLVLPRFLFYSVFFTGMFIVYLFVFRPRYLSNSYMVSLIISLSALIIFWYETFKVLKTEI